MIETVPPSADQAAPVTYPARSGQEKHDHRRDLARLGEPAERTAGADLREDLVAVTLLGREPGVARPCFRVAVGPGVTALQAGSRPPRERRQRAERYESIPRLHHRVGGQGRRWALARRRGDVDDRRASPQVRQRGTRRANGAHQVQLERRLPVVVGQIVELLGPRSADVVYEAVEVAEALDGGSDQPLRLTALREIAGDVQLADPRFAPTTRDDTRAFGLKLPRNLEADAARRAGDQHHLVA